MLRTRRVVPAALVAVIGVAWCLQSCVFSLPDVVSGEDAGQDAEAGGFVDCLLTYSNAPEAGTCPCYPGDNDDFWCGHAVIGAATGFFPNVVSACMPPRVALENPNALLSCHGGHWTLGRACANGCTQAKGIDAADNCAPPALPECGCYKNLGLVACANAVIGYADQNLCTPPVQALQNLNALLSCEGGVWQVVQDCPGGCYGTIAPTDDSSSDHCCG